MPLNNDDYGYVWQTEVEKKPDHTPAPKKEPEHKD